MLIFSMSSPTFIDENTTQRQRTRKSATSRFYWYLQYILTIFLSAETDRVGRNDKNILINLDHNVCIFLDDFGLIFKVIFGAKICPKIVKNLTKFRESVWAVVGGPLGSLLASFWASDTPREIVRGDIFSAPFPQEAPSRVMAYY